MKSKKHWGIEELIIDEPECKMKFLYMKKLGATGKHKHPNAKEIIYVQKGYIRIAMKHVFHILKAGTKVIIPPNQMHKISAIDDSIIIQITTGWNHGKDKSK